MLRAGADDLGGTLMEETISRMAGSMHGSAKTVAELREIGEGIGRPVKQRTTTYGGPGCGAAAGEAARRSLRRTPTRATTARGACLDIRQVFPRRIMRDLQF
jgi:hypothetical protein